MCVALGKSVQTGALGIEPPIKPSGKSERSKLTPWVGTTHKKFSTPYLNTNTFSMAESHTPIKPSGKSERSKLTP